MSQMNLSGRPRRIVWQSVITVLSAAVLISAEVFGAAFAGGWALANLMGLGDYGVYALQIAFLRRRRRRDGRLRAQRHASRAVHRRANDAAVKRAIKDAKTHSANFFGREARASAQNSCTTLRK